MQKNDSTFRRACKECMLMFEGLKIPYIDLKYGEAEAYCALLNKYGIVDGVLTPDSDGLHATFYFFFLFFVLFLYQQIHSIWFSVFAIKKNCKKKNKTKQKQKNQSIFVWCDNSIFKLSKK